MDRHNEYQPTVVMLCGWGLKAGMVCVWWQVKLSYLNALEIKLVRMNTTQIKLHLKIVNMT